MLVPAHPVGDNGGSFRFGRLSREQRLDELPAKAGQLAASPAVVQALWAVHAAAFGLDLAAIAVALIGLSYAAASVRLIPAWLTVAAWPGAACLLTAAVFTVALANGGPWGAVGLAGFIIWLVFVITASVSLLRNHPIP